MRVLVIRLSSFGDILQTLPAVDALASQGATVSYLTKKSFAPLVQHNPNVSRVLELSGTGSLFDLFTTAYKIHALNFTHIYDAHNNLRSTVLKLFLWFLSFFGGRKYNVITRSKNRWKRFLFFKLRRPVFKMPFRGADSFVTPLAPWGVTLPDRYSQHLYLRQKGEHPTLDIKPWGVSHFVALAPSAAWPTKRWPIDHWKELVRSLPNIRFVILGGPEDTFCDEIHQVSPLNTTNLAGRLNLMESCAAVEASQLLVSGDTGMLHAADQLNKKNIALIGPTAFGYPYNDSSVVLETQLYCKPCSKDGRDPCVNAVYQKCMKDISPQTVASQVTRLLGGL